MALVGLIFVVRFVVLSGGRSKWGMNAPRFLVKFHIIWETAEQQISSNLAKSRHQATFLFFYWAKNEVYEILTYFDRRDLFKECGRRSTAPCCKNSAHTISLLFRSKQAHSHLSYTGRNLHFKSWTPQYIENTMHAPQHSPRDLQRNSRRCCWWRVGGVEAC